MFRYVTFLSCLAVCCASALDYPNQTPMLPILPAPFTPINGKIVGGEETTILEVPWQVALRFLGNTICGGSLIRPDVVLSAAHCVIFPDLARLPFLFSCRAGTSVSTSGGQIRLASKIIIHPNYVFQDHDIAIFKLATRFNMASRSIAVIPLPVQDQVIPDDAKAIISGWGYTTENGNQSRIIRKVEVSIINQELCRTSYASAGYNVTDVEICAGDFEAGGKDTCQGDSGGPLVVNQQLIGITSWGEGCARPRLPGIYVRVPTFVNWIQSQL